MRSAYFTSMLYKSSVTPRFRQTDMAGICYFNEANNLFHDLYEDFLEAHIGPKTQWFQNDNWAVPIKSITSEFSRPLLAFETYEAELRVTNIGTSSFSLETQFTKKDQVYCTIKSTHVFMDITSENSMPIPEDILKKLKS